MSGANYAHCDVDPCLKPSGSTKVFYIGDEDLPFGTVVRHGECDDTQLAAAEARGYDRARTEAAAKIRSQAADIVHRALAEAGVSINAAEEHPFVLAMELAARIVEAAKETPDAV